MNDDSNGEAIRMLLNHIMVFPTNGMDFSGGCILVILDHFDTFGHFISKCGRFCSKT